MSNIKMSNNTTTITIRPKKTFKRVDGKPLSKGLIPKHPFQLAKKSSRCRRIQAWYRQILKNRAVEKTRAVVEIHRAFVEIAEGIERVSIIHHFIVLYCIK